MTIALYRRYRPERFAEVRGQEHVTDPLQQALRRDRVNHAYLFSGPRGCGKTTSARILARALNCHARVANEEGLFPDDPCGVCPSCVDLARGGGGSLDVIEIDAASHNGVDDARDLRERAVFAPARDKYKIFIIDEAHMVTPAGFNALLKIVEEPPPHTRFLFATTEPDKVIGTIRSRTHHYPFHLAPVGVLTTYLKELCDEENVPVESTVLPLVARAGAGSFRDALSVLDQLMAGAGDEGLTYERAVSLLGFTNASLLDDVVDALAARDGAGTFGAVERIVEAGHDPRRFVEDLLGRFRDLVIAAATGDAAPTVLPDMPDDQMQRLMAQAATMGQHELSRSADICNSALSSMVGATSPRLHLELLMARLMLPTVSEGQLGAGAVQDQLQRGVGSQPASAVSSAPQSVPSTPPAPAAGSGKKPSWRDLAGVPKKTPPGVDATPQPSPSAAESAPASDVPSADPATFGSLSDTSVTASTPAPPTVQGVADAWSAPGITPAGAVDLGNTSASLSAENSGTTQEPAPQVSSPAAKGPAVEVSLSTTAENTAHEHGHSPTAAPTDHAAAPRQTPVAGPVEAQKIQSAWPQVVDHLRTLNATAVKSLDYADILGVHSGRFGMRFKSQPAADSFTRQNLGGPIAEAIKYVTGIDVTVVCLGPNDRKAPTSPPGGQADSPRPTTPPAAQTSSAPRPSPQTSRAPRSQRDQGTGNRAAAANGGGESRDGSDSRSGIAPETSDAAHESTSRPPASQPAPRRNQQSRSGLDSAQAAPRSGQGNPGQGYPVEPEPEEWEVPPPEDFGPAEYVSEHHATRSTTQQVPRKTQSPQSASAPAPGAQADPRQTPGRANPVAVQAFGAASPTISTGTNAQDPWAVDVSSLPPITAPAKPAAPPRTPSGPVAPSGRGAGPAMGNGMPRGTSAAPAKPDTPSRAPAPHNATGTGAANVSGAAGPEQHPQPPTSSEPESPGGAHLDGDLGGAELDDPDAPADAAMGSKIGVPAVQRILKAEVIDVRETHAGVT